MNKIGGQLEQHFECAITIFPCRCYRHYPDTLAQQSSHELKNAYDVQKLPGADVMVAYQMHG
jgi:hypothetical protein